MSESPLDDLSDRTQRAGVAVLSDRTKLVAAVVVLLALLYGVLLLGNLAGFLSLALPAAFLWLLYRFVLAHERIADAQERRTRAAERRVDVAAAATGGGTTEADGDEPSSDRSGSDESGG